MSQYSEIFADQNKIPIEHILKQFRNNYVPEDIRYIIIHLKAR